MKAQPEPNAKVSQTISTVVRERFENKFNADLMTDELIKSLSGDRAQAENRRIVSFGTIKNLVFVGGETDSDAKIYHYKAETSKRTFLWRFAVNTDGKVSEMTLEDEE